MNTPSQPPEENGIKSPISRRVAVHVFQIVLTLCVAWLLVVSPLVTLLGAPLRMDDAQPHPADVIVVFSSGMTPGCWPDRYTLEREAYGLLLLRRGYSRSGKIIFSGGFIRGSSINIGECMGVFAQRLGIPENALVIEPKARTTYENAVHTRDIMRRNHWKTALLVTSASHMRRSVWTLEAQGVTTHPAPVPAPQRKSWIDPDRFSLLHRFIYEYVALLKYKWYGLI